MNRVVGLLWVNLLVHRYDLKSPPAAGVLSNGN